MAKVETKSQYFYTGQGPLDPKLLVSTYDKLLSTATWNLTDGTCAAYNGMITVVGNHTKDPSKNGIYYLFDPNANARVAPNVTKEENWHKVGENAEVVDLTEVNSKIDAIEASLAGITEINQTVKNNSDEIAKLVTASATYITGEALTAQLESYAKTANVVAATTFNTFKDETEASILSIASTLSTKADIVALNNYYKITDADNKFASKEDVYTKTEVDELLETISVDDEVSAKVEVLSAKLNGIDNTVTDAIDNAVKEINVNKLVQDIGDILILNGGDNSVVQE